MRLSLILRTAARLLVPLMILFSVFLMLRGHNEAGGGFIGGLVSASAFALYAMAYGTQDARRALYADPRTLMASGVGIALVSALIPLFSGAPFFKGLWTTLPGGVKLGTPILFDIGVYLLVVGMTLVVIYELDDDGLSLFPRDNRPGTTPPSSPAA
ncbi:Na(+)/H(+) antiporter subunit B [Longimonas halophila]|uniref:Na(+)/H(+) antiporter subunit B n=1 Tax=Longimonas halophila TaxID=1469170 RepID=A0A2H3NL86_9BACT|nr:Na+/H+ antiporter subunit B [Longimonas halophila]PEN06704.1 Na(+)/H(+) antiporter subunit B [Longimonas halophila]